MNLKRSHVISLIKELYEDADLSDYDNGVPVVENFSDEELLEEFCLSGLASNHYPDTPEDEFVILKD